VKNPNDVLAIKDNMNKMGFEYQYLNEKQDLFTQLIG
jgi:threonine dehydratase